jgi:alkylated DNA nucleotide flippase Atl1
MDGLAEQVLSLVDRIPGGHVLTYGDVAELTGAPTAWVVGQVLARHGHEVAWWRVLRADGTPAPHLRDRQLALLRAEGTPMRPSGDGVDLHRARWEATPDSAGGYRSADSRQTGAGRGVALEPHDRAPDQQSLFE